MSSCSSSSSSHVMILLIITILTHRACSASDECELYIAQSTIPNAGLGIFTAVERNPGETVGEGDVCIPIIELDGHNPDANKYYNPFNDYVWAGEVMGMKMEAGNLDIEALCPGLDCAINCNLALLNVGKSYPKYDDAGLHRFTHPGAGANTPYHNGTTKVIRQIPPGGELFKFYGDLWFKTRKVFEALPLSGDYPRAQKLLHEFFKKIGNSDANIRPIVYEDVLIPIRNLWNTRLVNALPETYKEALVARDHDIGTIHQPNATRSIQWLKENGKCVDHITPGKSTIEGAGNGAFAKRNLQEGSIITGSPLHHIPFRETMIPMYKLIDGDNSLRFYNMTDKKGSQILLNYCFGHSQSSLLLCPYGAGVSYINHNQTLANVKLVWSNNGLTSHDDSWLSKTPTDMLESPSTHLALDYMATRDIKQGEELFLDYGDEFEEAWKEHERTWVGDHGTPGFFYVSARHFNEIMEGTPLRTMDEVQFDPYPPNIHMRCHDDIYDFLPGRITESIFTKISDWTKTYGYECEVVERNWNEEFGFVYSIRLRTEILDRWEDDFDEPEVLAFEGVPRSAIKFFDSLYTTDLHLNDAFRHEIGLPEELMQDAWKNLPKESTFNDEL